MLMVRTEVEKAGDWRNSGTGHLHTWSWCHKPVLSGKSEKQDQVRFLSNNITNNDN